MWFRRLKRPPPPADTVDDAFSELDRMVAAGFAPRDEILDSVLDLFDDIADRIILRAQLKPRLDAALAAHREAQSTWPETTDCDRLDAAFAELESRGILARQNYWCCGTCGCAAINDEMEQAAPGSNVRGYVFYHEQDTESAVEGYGVCLNYGDPDFDDKASVAIGEEVRETLQRHGLEVEWNGSIEQRISVSLDWKRRGPPAG